jgi:hypothetical protein
MALGGGNARGWSMVIGERCCGRSDSGCCARLEFKTNAMQAAEINEIVGNARIRAIGSFVSEGDKNPHPNPLPEGEGAAFC